jgi:hypothetical protein
MSAAGFQNPNDLEIPTTKDRVWRGKNGGCADRDR